MRGIKRADGHVGAGLEDMQLDQPPAPLQGCNGEEEPFYQGECVGRPASGEEVELWTGAQLEHKEVAHPGDYLFIPAEVPHVAVNCSKTTPAVFVGVRNEPSAQESIVMLPELDTKVP